MASVLLLGLINISYAANDWWRDEKPKTIPATSKMPSPGARIRDHLGIWLSPIILPSTSSWNGTFALLQLACQSLNRGRIFDRRSNSSHALQILKNGALLLSRRIERII